VHPLIKRYLSGDAPNLGQIDYQRAGAGRSKAAAFYDPALVPDPAAVLTEKLGPLAWFTIDAAADPPPPLPDPVAIAVMSDADKLAIRARLQAGHTPPSPESAAQEELDCVGLDPALVRSRGRRRRRRGPQHGGRRRHGTRTDRLLREG